MMMESYQSNKEWELMNVSLLEQIQEILRLLEAAKDDLEAWVDTVEELGIDTDETKNLISEIRSTLHEVGF